MKRHNGITRAATTSVLLVAASLGTVTVAAAKPASPDRISAATFANGAAFCNGTGGAEYTVSASLTVAGGSASLDGPCQVDLGSNTKITLRDIQLTGAGSLEILGGSDSTAEIVNSSIKLGGFVNIDPGADFGTGLGGSGGTARIVNSALTSTDATSPYPIAVTGSCDGADGHVVITNSALVDKAGQGEVDVIASTPSCQSTDPEGGTATVTNSVMDSGGHLDFVTSTSDTRVTNVWFVDGKPDVRGPDGGCTIHHTVPATRCNQ